MDRLILPGTRRSGGALDLAPLAREPIYFFDLAPVLERSCSALACNPERIQNICEQSLTVLDEQDSVLFVENGFYVVFSSCGGNDAEALANRINISLLKILFGTDSLAGEQMMSMYRTAPLVELKARGAGSSHVLERASVIAARKQREAAGEEEHKRGLPEESHEQIHQLATRGFYPKAHVQLSFVPVYDLKRSAPALFFCSPLGNRNGRPVFGYRAFGNLSPLESVYVDLAILRYAARFGRQLLQSGSLIAVGVPVSAESLSWSRGRQIYQTALRQIDIANSPQLIPLLDGLSPGTPPSRIADLLTVLRPFVRRPAVYLPDSETTVDRSGAIGAAGYAVALPKGVDSAVAHRTAFWLARVCLTQNAFSCLTGVNSQEGLDAAVCAGLRFAAGSALAPRALTREASLEYARTLCRDTAGPDLSALN